MTLQNKHIALYLLLLLLFPLCASAQSWERVYADLRGKFQYGTQAEGDNMLLINSSIEAEDDALNGEFLIKLNAEGQLLWKHRLDVEGVGQSSPRLNSRPVLSTDDHYYIFAIDPANTAQVLLQKLNTNGKVTWAYPLPAHMLGAKLIAQPGGGVVFSSISTNSSIQRQLTQLNAQGQIVFSTTLSTQIQTADFYKNPTAPGFIFKSIQRVVKTDEVGNVLSVQDYQLPDYPFGQTFYQSYLVGEDLIAMGEGGDYYCRQVRVTPNNDIVYDELILNDESLLIYDGYQTEDGIISMTVGGLLDLPFPTRHFLVFKTDFNGNLLWSRKYNHRPDDSRGATLSALANDNILALGTYLDYPKVPYAIRLNSEGVLFNNVISGNVIHDLDNDCTEDLDDADIQNWYVSASKDDQFLTARSDENGNYLLHVDTGNYEITLHPPNVNWELCDNNINIDFAQTGQDMVVDFFAYPTAGCPDMTVSSGMNYIFPCFSQQMIVNYCNNGSETATDVHVDIAFNPFYTVLDSDVPSIDLGDNNHRFEIEDVPALDCGSFTIDILLDCDAPIAINSFPIEMQIFPDTLCGNAIPPNWNGALLDVKGNCLNDLIHFEIENIGLADMDGISNIIIIEDAILRVEQPVQLPAGGSEGVEIAANGSTYTLLAEQVEGAPGNTYPIAIVEGCGTNEAGGYSTGFGNQFPQVGEAGSSNVLLPVVFTPTGEHTMFATPEGYGDAHYVPKGALLNYLIYFENTGTDTVYNVLIKDSLSQYLDPVTIVPGASSHPYTFEMTQSGVMTFILTDLNIPPFNNTDQASGGYVSFSALLLDDVPAETVIENQASIYLNSSSDAQLTNAVFHTTGDNYIEVGMVSTTYPGNQDVTVGIFPNPFISKTTFKVSGVAVGRLDLSLYDVHGRLVRQQQTVGNTTLELNRGNLPAGLYFYELTSPEGLKSVGKVMVE